MGEGLKKLIPEDIKEGGGNTEVTAYTPNPNRQANRSGAYQADFLRAKHNEEWRNSKRPRKRFIGNFFPV